MPGEGQPPRVVAHITFDWPTWSQTAYRRWYVDEVLDEQPTIEMEIVFRVQRLSEQPDPQHVQSVLPETSPLIGNERLERAGATVEIGYLADTGVNPDFAIEITYEGLYELAEETLVDGASKLLDEHFGTLGAWIATTLVKLGDLRLTFLGRQRVGLAVLIRAAWSWAISARARSPRSSRRAAAARNSRAASAGSPRAAASSARCWRRAAAARAAASSTSGGVGRHWSGSRREARPRRPARPPTSAPAAPSARRPAARGGASNSSSSTSGAPAAISPRRHLGGPALRRAAAGLGRTAPPAPGGCA